MLKASVIREMTDKEIADKISLEEDNLQRMRMEHAISPLDNPSKLRILKKDIARLKTILHLRNIKA